MSQWKVVDFYIWLMLKESKKRKKEEKIANLMSIKYIECKIYLINNKEFIK